MKLLDLPACILQNILEYLSYDEVSKKRLVSKSMDTICQQVLNRGFFKLITRHGKNLRRVKALLPRRESERRSHPLNRHAEILTCIETRISMLSMTYTKYIELNLCCFIPGKVLDEISNLLHLIETSPKPLRAHEVLQELRDISSMAIEHFDDNIAPVLKQTYLNCGPQKYLSSGIIGSSNNESFSVQKPIRSDVLGSYEKNINQCQEAKANRMAIVRMERKYNDVTKKLNQAIQIQNKLMRQLRHNSVRISEMNTHIVDLKRRLEESDAKNREISVNVNQITYENSSKAVTNSAIASLPDKSQNIKPRTATIILKRRINETVSSFNLEKPFKKRKHSQ